MAALDTAHAALALGLPTLLSPRLSSSDPRPRHRGLSHHTATVLELLLGSVRVPVPEVELEGWPTGDARSSSAVDLPSVLDALHEVCDDRHDVAVEPVDLDGYAAQRAAGADDGPDDRRGPAVLRRRARRRAARWPAPSGAEG